jgi:hypothetical protein
MMLSCNRPGAFDVLLYYESPGGYVVQELHRRLRNPGPWLLLDIWAMYV